MLYEVITDADLGAVIEGHGGTAGSGINTDRTAAVTRNVLA